jgi:hypothetical protein
MNFKKFWPVDISLGLFLVGILVFAVIAKWDALPLNLDPKNIVGLLGPITLAAAFIERAVEVVISPWRDPDASHLVNKLDQAKKHAALTALTATVTSAAATAAALDPAIKQAAQDSTDAAHQATANASLADAAITSYRGVTKQYAYAISLLLGMFVAYCGVRGLANLCGTNAFNNIHNGQRLMFNIVDVVLTAAVLAGGANGIHSIVNVVTTFADVTSDKNKQSANG